LVSSLFLSIFRRLEKPELLLSVPAAPESPVCERVCQRKSKEGNSCCFFNAICKKRDCSGELGYCKTMFRNDCWYLTMSIAGKKKGRDRSRPSS
jgi:hypothetical protein